jgi:hypothetical protein
MTTHILGKYILLACLFVVLSFIAYSMLSDPDQRSITQKINAMTENTSDASDQKTTSY